MMTKIKKQIAMLLVLICAFTICPQVIYASEDSSQHETVRVGFFAMNGYHMMDEEGNRSGYGWDFLRLMARYLDVNYEYVGYDKSWEDMLKMLDDGEIDMVTSAKKTPEREEKYDFSKPIGSNQCIITVKRDNHSIVEQDYDTYNGMRVALLNGNTRNNDFAEFAREKGFSYTPVYFNMTSEMEEALQDGRVDAIVSSSMRALQEERVIEKFASEDIYVIVKKGNTELLDEVNYAIDQLNAAEGDWKTELYNCYYSDNNDKYLEYTDEEKALINQCSSKDEPLMILCDPTRYPYSYVEDGEMKGILPDYFRKLADYIGISYQFIICNSREEYQMYQSDKADVDLCIDARFDTDNYAELNGWGISAPYIDMRMSKVVRRNFSGDIKTVACVDQGSSKSIEDALAPGAEKIICGTRQDAMQAVKDGKADAAFVYYYQAKAFINNDTSGTLIDTVMDELVYQYRIVVLAKQNHALAGILTKAIYAMPENAIEDIASYYTSFKASNMTLAKFVQLYPISSLIFMAVMWLLLIILVIFVMKGQANKKILTITRQMANEMKELAEQAQNANRAKTSFLHNMSHDIRTPINGITGMLSVIQKSGNDPEKVKECLDKIGKSSKLLLSMVNDVLDMAKLESDFVSVTDESVNLDQVCSEITELVVFQAEEAGLTVTQEHDDYTGVYVWSNALKLKKILMNLFTNSIKYNKPNGSICTSMKTIERSEEYITCEFKIRDTGIGMSKEFIENELFTAFVQGNQTARSTYQGTGLGMPIVKNLVEKMGGTIRVESKLGEGSCFTVVLPFRIDTTPKQNTEIITEDVDISGLHILLVEDNELNMEIAEFILENQEVKIDKAVNGQEAVEKFESSEIGKYDVILMDIMMPVMDGLTATKTIRALERQDAKTIPIIAMTANAFKEDADKCLEAGMNAHLAKPLDIEKVKRTIYEQVKNK